ncbi:hypothetical protein ACN9MJ_10420 [Acidovorax facilis]|uniref:hypothetical protein n=1 Tax=Acidovorax facilis TaxID=12917 RepID=UPI003CEA89F0
MTEVSTRPSAGATKHRHVATPPLPQAPVAASQAIAPAQSFASVALQRASEAEAVLRTVAEDGSDDASNDAVWGVMTIVGILLNDLERIHNQPSLDDCQYVLCHLEQAIGMLSLFTGDLVLNATSALLNASLTSLISDLEARP